MMLVVLLMAASSMANAQNDVISEVNVTGNRRIPAETIKARIFSKAGDIYDAAGLERDFNSLWNTGYFEDISFCANKRRRVADHCSGEGKADDPRNQLCGPEFGFEQRCARPV
jgi:outer membrane protein assembly factor BamA